ncbi:hypothetical protein [Anaerotignum faecicola]
MGLFDFFKKKATEEQPQTEEQQEGVLELDGVEVEKRKRPVRNRLHQR